MYYFILFFSLEELNFQRSHLSVRLNKITSRDRLALGALSNHLNSLENESKVLLELSSNNIDIESLINGLDNVNLDHERAFEKLSVRFLANKTK